jgi:tetratricopeptide (TPR) repeat protein
MCYRIPLCTLMVLSAFTLFASDERELGLIVRAQSDFDRVELSRQPQIQETSGCVQSQVAAIAVAARAELSILYFRNGYCELIGATINHRASDFQQAAASFEKSIAAWPDTLARNLKSAYPPPVPHGLRILAAISPLLSGGQTAEALETAAKRISEAVDNAACPSSVMSPNLCQSLLQVGHQWLGWIALQRGDLIEANRDLSDMPQSAWAHWIAGERAFRDRDYEQASTQDRQAVDLWTRIRPGESADIAQRLAPQPNLPVVWMQLGRSQLLAGDSPAAATSLDSAIKGNPSLARAIYYRARGEELQGQTEPAMADYALASRTAFANAEDLKSGEAHLYRGILFFRRKDYSHAEDEFSSALNFTIPPDLVSDAEAWRHMAAVAGGACGASRQMLEDSLTRVSPLFPKQEARSLASVCPLSDARPVTGGLP